MCDLVKWMVEEGKVRQVFEVQKGGCEDASEYCFFFCGSLVLVRWQAFISSLVMKLDFISLPSPKSIVPFAGLQHMQQCQVNFHSIFGSRLLIQMNSA